MLIKTDVIVLKKSKFGEGEAILTLFSKKLGKVKAVAKGWKKGKGKNSSTIQPFLYGEAVLFKGKNLYQISQMDLKNSFYKLQDDVIKIGYASYILELTESIIIEGQTNNRLFETLIEVLTEFLSKKSDFITLVKAYEMKLLVYAGYKPEMNICVCCGSNELGKVKFSSRQGGIICGKCFNTDPYAMNISTITMDVIVYLMKTELSQIAKLKIKEEIRKELDKIIKNYIYTQMDKSKFKSLIFLEAVEALK